MGEQFTKGLKPCPFCGCAPDVRPSGDGTGTMIECLSRDCVKPHVSYYGDGEADKRWNARASCPDLVEALRPFANLTINGADHKAFAAEFPEMAEKVAAARAALSRATGEG